jgi:hypothetical protein
MFDLIVNARLILKCHHTPIIIIVITNIFVFNESKWHLLQILSKHDASIGITKVPTTYKDIFNSFSFERKVFSS